MEYFTLRRSGATAVSAALILQLCCGFPASAAVPQSDSIFIRQEQRTAAQRPSPEDPVRIVIELEERPLLDDRTVMQTFSSAEDYLASDHVRIREQSLARDRSNAMRALARSGLDVSVTHEYSAVFNGLAVEARYGDLESIRALDGVKSAYVAREHHLIEPVSYEPMLHDSVPAIGGDLTQELNYTGKGSVVAILDTGLDTAHTAFSATVNSPRYTKDDIARLQRENRLTVGTLSVDVLYKNEKIPYAYDYADRDTNVSGGESHGTHVAGIVGANSGGVITGVAPDAQLLIMKIFGDGSGGALDDDILAALEDSVKLGADVINMSLGLTAGFPEGDTPAVRKAYQRVSDAGISLMCAAGNDYTSTYHGGFDNDLSLTSNPDNSTVASPSTYSSALSVASSNNIKATAHYIQAGDRRIRFSDSAENAKSQLIRLDGTYPYADCGVGSAADFAGKQLSGTIALIQRGGEVNGEPITFAQKEAAAQSAGAIAAIIYDNVVGEMVSMATAHAIPCVFVSKADGEYLLSRQDRTLTVGPGQMGTFTDATSGRMSDFSSWGVSHDLKLKPEITAPGGEIYSSLPNNLYGSMSGTSMASPHMAGAAAIMKQYLTEQPDGLELTAAQRRDLSNALMMSTAVPVRHPNGLPASPREQGAGLVRLDLATSAKACLWGEGGSRPVLNFGESMTGSFSGTLRGENLSDAPITYQVSAAVQVPEVIHENGHDFMALSSRTLTEDEVSVTLPSRLTLTAGASAGLPVQISLTDAGRAGLKAQFPNGIFVEGFVTLTPVSGDTVVLSAPFLGFFGDWANVPIFDVSGYSGETPNTTEMWLGQFRDNDNGGDLLGTVEYGDTKKQPEADHIAIKGGERGLHVTPICALLRNVDELSFSVSTSGGGLVYEERMGREHKSTYSMEGFYTPMAHTGWAPFDTWNDPLPDGRYTLRVSGTADGRTQSVDFPITVDSEAPELLSSEIDGSVWRVTVRDNHYIQAAAATMGSAPLTGWINPDASAPGEAIVLEFDLSDKAFQGLTQCKIALADFADNQFVSDYISLSGAVIVEPKSVILDKTQQQLTAGDTTVLRATVLPENASNRTVTWSSSAPEIVSVVNGQLSALAPGSAVITARTINGLTASCRVTVSPRPVEPTAGKALASVSAPASVSGSELPFTFQLEQLQNVATVSFTFRRDSGLTGGTVVGKSGFTVLDGIRWNGDTGVLMLCYLKDGAGGSLSRRELTDIAQVVLHTAADSGSLGITLENVRVSGYDEAGKAVYLDSGIKTSQARIRLGDSGYDVNGDGTVDQLDITSCQMFYRARRGDSDWSGAQVCDVDHSGVVDIADMILILNAFS